MKYAAFFLLVLQSCNGQQAVETTSTASSSLRHAPGPCEECETMFAGMPKTINTVDTSAAWEEEGEKMLLEGTVYMPDGRTPAPNVVVYYWHTDIKGYYPQVPDIDGVRIRHGKFRGWVKTGADGKYKVYTIRPAQYPSRTIPAHVHFLIKEPDMDGPYYIDDLMFDDDPLVSAADRQRKGRGGNGICKLQKNGEMWLARRDVVLGKNVD
ncbi:MAG: intradiol ring-cleavage dioxygenase [Saprospiraceae bacterium]|nr:intradiol ring-cleavage dioxygenase [Saprospiraceae bacterium]